MRYTGATLLTTLLERQGIRVLPGIPGGAILPFYDALYDSSIQHVLARHEQGAGFMAQGIARVTGRAAACVATSGPGATNLVTAIADARLDSVPMVAFTGQVASSLIGTDAFQEIDMYGMTVPITKHNFLVRDIRELLRVVPLAFEIAESGRPGPVVVDVPKDVQTAVIDLDENELPPPGCGLPMMPCAESAIEAFVAMLEKSKRPVMYLGGGVIAANASSLALRLARRIGAPVVCTLNGLGAVPAGDPLFMGMLGMHGTRATHTLLDETDLLVVVGARFDDRATGKAAEFCPNASIIHVDIDRAEFGKIMMPGLSIESDAADVLERVLTHLDANPAFAAGARAPVDSEWTRRAAELRAAHPLRHPSAEVAPLHPVNICRYLGTRLPSDAIIATDVGQHQMWTAQSYPFRKPRTFLSSGGLGTMGFGLPAAIGAALAEPERRVVCISGDGSLQMNIQELAVMADLGLSVTVLVFNNAQLGLVRQQQELFYRGRYSASNFLSSPDFAAIARAYGIHGCKIDPTKPDPLGQIAAALAIPGPCLVDIPITSEANVLPMVPPGAANRETIEDAK